jgi:hypothetical protein
LQRDTHEREVKKKEAGVSHEDDTAQEEFFQHWVFHGCFATAALDVSFPQDPFVFDQLGCYRLILLFGQQSKWGFILAFRKKAKARNDIDDDE